MGLSSFRNQTHQDGSCPYCFPLNTKEKGDEKAEKDTPPVHTCSLHSPKGSFMEEEDNQMHCEGDMGCNRMNDVQLPVP